MTMSFARPAGSLAKTAQDHRPLAVRVYESVRDSIVTGQIEPNTQLVQEQVAEALGVSRTPVRDALLRLAHEGLITRISGGGYLVNDLAEQDIHDIFEVRQSLESLAVRLSFGHHTPGQLTLLGALVDDMAQRAADSDAPWFELNRDFHVALVAPCTNRALLSILGELWNKPVNRLITRQYVSDPEHIHRMVGEHRALVEAAASTDADTMNALTLEHLKEGYGETSVERRRSLKVESPTQEK
ncbi:MAG: GntR family transcriptional regulator [Actinobacteria bacterium]|nr:GntR family transcriptional regulator [Actinomycetota bacterium]